MNTSQNLFSRAKKLIPGGVNSPVRAFRGVGGEPFFTERAEGCYLYTTDNTQLIDYVGTWGPAIMGHNHPEIAKAVTEALAKGTSFGTPNPYEVQMAEAIVDIYPSIEKVRMVNSGTEATMSCIRLARGFTGREKIIKFEGCYHGHSDALLVKAGSGALTHGNPDSAGVTKGAAKDTVLLPFNDLNKLREVFENVGEQIAAIILEPYPANMGLVFPAQDFLSELRRITQEYEALLIYDEVMTGFRISLSGVQGALNHEPDLTALGKIIGGGLPVGAFGGREDVMSFLAPEGPVYQAGTLSGNPLAMAAGLKNLQLLKGSDPYSSLDAKGKKIKASLEDSFSQKGIPAKIPQAGSMFSIFFSEQEVANFNDVLKSEKVIFSKLFGECLKRNLFLPPSAFETLFISAAHNDSVIDQTCEILSESISSI